MRPLIVVQARMGSSRLPGKTLVSIGGRTILEWVLHRVSLAGINAPVVVATTKGKDDDPVVALCRKHRVKVFRGSQHDVLDRFYRCADQFEDVDTIIRVTADCPLLCPTLLDATVTALNGDAYAGVHGAPEGFGQEAFTLDALHESWELATTGYDREHVIPYMVANLTTKFVSWNEHTTTTRFTVNTGQDIADLAALHGRFGDRLFDMDSYALMEYLA